jgi:predicted dienelactone hydrolase
VINVQHPGSDTSILGNGMFQAMNAVQLIARAKDISFVIGYATSHPREGACDLSRIEADHIGMSGHSFGAVTTQAVSGEVYPGGTLSDARIKASIAFSPSPPTHGTAEEAFARIAIPFFSITGTRDSVAFTPFTAESRPKVYEAMKPGGKYLLIFKDAEHLNFGGQRGARWPVTPVSTHVQAVVKDATTDFWRWTLKGDTAARERLDALGTRIGPDDSFAHK